MPDAAIDAPPVADELSQPRSGPAAGFEHGQAKTPATPGSQRLVNAVASRSRTNTSSRKFESPATRLPAMLPKQAYRPSGEIVGRSVIGAAASTSRFPK